MAHMLLICESPDNLVRAAFSEFVTSSLQLLAEASSANIYMLEVEDTTERIANAVLEFQRGNPKVPVHIVTVTRHDMD